METTPSGKNIVTRISFLSESTFVLRFTRENIEFRAGQHIIVGLRGDPDQREYSVYSGENDDFIEILVREVRQGKISPKLRECKPGDLLQVNGPFGTFGIEPYNRYSKKNVFIATGTGISPFHSMIRSYPGLDYTMIHGVSYASEAYDRSEYDPDRYILCTSREISTGFNGRVTDFIKSFRTAPGASYFLCGNGSMIYEVSHILMDKGIPDENIQTEIYF
jgi:ferredoxin--NADP+ reductase/benzoate/toluate 1,2-dioxygenase reductase subunit